MSLPPKPSPPPTNIAIRFIAKIAAASTGAKIIGGLVVLAAIITLVVVVVAVKALPAEDCIPGSDWTDWTDCYKNEELGKWVQTTKRIGDVPAKRNGLSCPASEQHINCPAVDCVKGVMGSWGKCEQSQDGIFRQSRIRLGDKVAKYGGLPCPTTNEKRVCNPSAIECKVSDWTEWLTPTEILGAENAAKLPNPIDPCQKWKIILQKDTNDHTFYKIRTRSITRQPSLGGQPCPHLIDFHECPQEQCEWGAYGDWLPCAPYKKALKVDPNDNKYYKVRGRSATKMANYGAPPCNPNDQYDFNLCDPQPEVFFSEWNTVAIPQSKLSSRCENAAPPKQITPGRLGSEINECMMYAYQNDANLIEYNPITKICNIKKCTNGNANLYYPNPVISYAPNLSHILMNSNLTDNRTSYHPVLTGGNFTSSNCPRLWGGNTAGPNECIARAINLGGNVINYKAQQLTLDQAKNYDPALNIHACNIKRCPDPNNLQLAEPTTDVDGSTPLGWTVLTNNPKLKMPMQIISNPFKRATSKCSHLYNDDGLTLNQCYKETINRGGNVIEFRKLNDDGSPLGRCNVKNCPNHNIEEYYDDPNKVAGWDVYAFNSDVHDFRKVQDEKSMRAVSCNHHIRPDHNIYISHCDFGDINNNKCYDDINGQKYQRVGRIYRDGNKFYKAINNCAECVGKDPNTWPNSLRPYYGKVPPLNMSYEYQNTLNNCATAANMVGANTFGYKQWNNGRPHGECYLYNCADNKVDLMEYNKGFSVYTKNTGDITGGHPDDLIPPAPPKPPTPSPLDVAKAIGKSFEPDLSLDDPVGSAYNLAMTPSKPVLMLSEGAWTVMAGIGDNIPGMGPVFDLAGNVIGGVFNTFSDPIGTLSDIGNTFNPTNWF